MSTDHARRHHAYAIPPSPLKLRLLVDRFRTHVTEERVSVDALRIDLETSGFDSVGSFCQAMQLPRQTAEQWKTFGVAPEMAAMIRNMAETRLRLRSAVENFDEWNHVGITDFLVDRKFI